MTDLDAGDAIHQAQPTHSSILRSAAVGAASGVAGTLVMSALMLPAQWVGLLGTQPPRRVSDRALDHLGLGRRVGEQDRRVGTVVTHLAIGVGSGAALGILRNVVGSRAPAAGVGLAFGAALWAVNYIAVAPALELFPPPDRDRPGRPPVMFAANMLYGAVTASLIDRLSRRGMLGA
jgi:hypothetical protein